MAVFWASRVSRYAHAVRLWQIASLTTSERNSGEDTIETYYKWRGNRAMTFAKGTAAAALSILTAWLIPFLKNEYEGTDAAWVLIVPITLITALAGLGVLSFIRMDRIHASYITAMVWLQRLR